MYEKTNSEFSTSIGNSQATRSSRRPGSTRVSNTPVIATSTINTSTTPATTPHSGSHRFAPRTTRDMLVPSAWSSIIRAATSTTPSPTSQRRFGEANDTATPTTSATIGVAVHPAAQRQVRVGRRNERQRSASIVRRWAWLHQAKLAAEISQPTTSSADSERVVSSEKPSVSPSAGNSRASATTEIVAATVARRRAVDADGRSIGGRSSSSSRSACRRGGSVVDRRPDVVDGRGADRLIDERWQRGSHWAMMRQPAPDVKCVAPIMKIS